MNEERTTRKTFGEALKSVDVYGKPVGFTFKDKSKYQTTLGAGITIVCAAMMLSFLIVCTNKLISAEDPFFSMTTRAREDASIPIDVWALGFMFAVQDIDPRFGRVQVLNHSWNYEEADHDITTPIQMVPCTELDPGEAYEHHLNN